MQYLRRSLILSLSLIVLMAVSTSVAFAQDPDRGSTIWAEYNCLRCHGEMGEGIYGATLAGTEATAEEWITQIRTPRRNMPSYTADQMPDQDIQDLQAYFASLEKPAEGGFGNRLAQPENAPAGQVAMFDNRCVACHGENGPSGGFIRREEVPTVEAITTQIRTPRNNMPAFSEAQVSAEEIADITAFLASQVSPPQLPESGAAEAPYGAIAAWLLVALGLAAVASGWLLRRLWVRA